MPRLKVYVDPAHERAVVGPYEGGYQTTTSSWQYEDLTAYVNSYVRMRAATGTVYVCMVASASVTPSTATGSDFSTSATAELFQEGEVDQWVVQEDRPFIAWKRGGGSDGVIFVRPA